MKPVTRARLAGALAGAAGAGLLVTGHYGAGLGALSAGAAAVLLVTERGVPDALPDQSVGGSLSALARLATNLHLEGRGIVFPGRTPQEDSRLFVPAQDTTLADVGRVDLDVTLQRDPSGALGLVLPPPARDFERAWRDAHGLPIGSGAEEATQHVRQAFAHFGLGRDVSVARSGDRLLRIAYEPQAHATTCRRAREEDAPWHLQGGCPSCSLLAVLVARAYGAPVRVRDAGTDGARVVLELEVGARSPA